MTLISIICKLILLIISSVATFPLFCDHELDFDKIIFSLKTKSSGIHTIKLCPNLLMSVDYNLRCVDISVGADILWKQCDPYFVTDNNAEFIRDVQRSLLAAPSTLEPIDFYQFNSTEVEDFEIEWGNIPERLIELWQQYTVWVILGALGFLLFVIILTCCLCKIYHCCCCAKTNNKSQKGNVTTNKGMSEKQNRGGSYESIESSDDDMGMNHNVELELLPIVQERNTINKSKYEAVGTCEQERSEEESERSDSSDMFREIADNDNIAQTKQTPLLADTHILSEPRQSSFNDAMVVDLPTEIIGKQETDTNNTGTVGEGFDFNSWCIQTLKECAPDKYEWKEYWNNFLKHKITEDVLISLIADKKNKSEEWKELIPTIGPRIRFQQEWEKTLLKQQQTHGNTNFTGI